MTDAASMSVRELNIFMYGAVALGGLGWARDRVELSDVFETFGFETLEVVDAFETLEALDALDALDALEAFRAEGYTAVEDCLTAEIGICSEAAAVLGRRDRKGTLTIEELAAGLASIKSTRQSIAKSNEGTNIDGN